MNWYRDGTRMAYMLVNVMCAVDAREYPTFAFEGFAHLLSSDGPHTSIVARKGCGP
jgi:hypothetical protein